MLSQQGGGERGVAEFRSWCLRPETLTSCTRVCSTGWVHFWVKGRTCSERGVSSSLSLCAGAGQLFAASIKLFLQMPPVTNPTHQPPPFSCPKSPFDLARSSQKTVVLDPPFFDPGFFLFESEELQKEKKNEANGPSCGFMSKTFTVGASSTFCLVLFALQKQHLELKRWLRS